MKIIVRNHAKEIPEEFVARLEYDAEQGLHIGATKQGMGASDMRLLAWALVSLAESFDRGENEVWTRERIEGNNPTRSSPIKTIVLEQLDDHRRFIEVNGIPFLIFVKPFPTTFGSHMWSAMKPGEGSGLGGFAMSAEEGFAAATECAQHWDERSKSEPTTTE